jgi:hypothetical protein
MHYGLEINEEAMSIFSSIGDTSPTPCNCDGLRKLSEHMDDIIQSTPAGHPKDYKLYTAKDEKSVNDAIFYAFRDTLQF